MSGNKLSLDSTWIKEKKVLSKENRVKKGKIVIGTKLLGKFNGKIQWEKSNLHKELSKFSSSDKGTVRVRGPRVGTIRRGAATGVGEFQGRPKFCL